jgi:hypothetical protein
MKPRKPLKRRQKPLKRSPLRPSTKAIRPRKADPAKRAWAKHRDMKYQAWIREQPCVVMAIHVGLIECCHVKTRGTGGADRRNVVSMCSMHHRIQHSIGILAFQKTYGVDLTAEALRLDAEYEAQL